MGESGKRPVTPASGTPATAELPKVYRPSDHEGRIWELWDRAGAFHADPAQVRPDRSNAYSIVIPPPNVTDRLHLGHALNNTLQDILARAHRMKGCETLWMPGTDHAGIATQAVVERRLRKEGRLKGSLRDSMSREEFVAIVQSYKDEYEATITGQLKALGCSCDWERQRFTMDEQCAAAVHEAFFRLFRDGLIHRGKRLVNWDPVLQTAVADDECEDVEVDGQFYYLRYPLVHASRPGEDAMPVTWSELRTRGWPAADDTAHDDEKQAWVTVATTRPETYLGDTAVAVNPKDPRARPLRGLFVELPLIGRIIPIIEDEYVVMPAREGQEAQDPKAAFATGFLKVTPAHDPNDYEIGRRHGLTLINVMAPDASITDRHGWTDVGGAHLFVGLSREEARKKVIAEFKARTVGSDGTTHLFAGAKPHRHSVKHSDRSKAAIEPYLSDQWFVRVTDSRMAPAANRSLGAAESGRALRFHPARYARTYEQWHENIRDWCISRQLWWGHQVPVWTRTAPEDAGADADQLRRWCDEARIAVWRQGTDEEERKPDSAESTVHVCVRDLKDEVVIEALQRAGFSRDPDVLDTWFSSALWPMSTMGWPQDTDLLRGFNPTAVLCTAREIITLWVSRMVMFSRYLMPQDWPRGPRRVPAGGILEDMGRGEGPVPFRDVFIHAMIQDGEGRKMSKSLGNGVDPLDIIASQGADAMRFTLCQMTTHTQDVRMPVEVDASTGRNTSPKFDIGRNFCNKLWNACRFAMGILTSREAEGTPVNTGQLSLADRWMLSRLQSGVEEVNDALQSYSFSVYAQTVYDLLWRDFCDWYLEAIKPTVAADPAQRAVLAHALETIVRLLHPIAPFITETIWEQLREIETAPVAGMTLEPSRRGGVLCTAGWPRIDPSLRDERAEREFERMRTLVTAIREVRALHQVPPKRRVTLHAPAAVEGVCRAVSPLVEALAGLDRIVGTSPSGPAVAFAFESGQCQLSNLADEVDASAERQRLQKLIADLEKSVGTLEGRLANPGYAQKAPPAMVQQTRDQLSKAGSELSAAREALSRIS